MIRKIPKLYYPADTSVAGMIEILKKLPQNKHITVTGIDQFCIIDLPEEDGNILFDKLEYVYEAMSKYNADDIADNFYKNILKYTN